MTFFIEGFSWRFSWAYWIWPQTFLDKHVILVKRWQLSTKIPAIRRSRGCRRTDSSALLPSFLPLMRLPLSTINYFPSERVMVFSLARSGSHQMPAKLWCEEEGAAAAFQNLSFCASLEKRWETYLILPMMQVYVRAFNIHNYLRELAHVVRRQRHPGRGNTRIGCPKFLVTAVAFECPQQKKKKKKNSDNKTTWLYYEVQVSL